MLKEEIKFAGEKSEKSPKPISKVKEKKPGKICYNLKRVLFQ